MSSSARLNRRSFFGRITGGIVAGAALAFVHGGPGRAAPRRTGISDRDPTDATLEGGPPHDSDPGDRVGFPAHSPTGYTGYTDRDTYDTAYHGRRSGSAVTDHDGRDRAGHGMGSGPSLTDRDPTDRVGQGHGSGPRSPTGVTDRDRSDGANYGRGPPITNSTSLGRQANPGVTDNDPNDTAGHGRGTGGGGPR
jgi:hypothetical protein